MRGRIALYDWEMEHWSRHVKRDIGVLMESKICISFDYTSFDISPAQLVVVLQNLGWWWASEDRYDEYHTVVLNHTDYTRELCVFSDADTFKLTLGISGEEE